MGAAGCSAGGGAGAGAGAAMGAGAGAGAAGFSQPASNATADSEARVNSFFI